LLQAANVKAIPSRKGNSFDLRPDDFAFFCLLKPLDQIREMMKSQAIL